MYKLKVATRFKKDIKRYAHNKIIQDKLEDIIKLLLMDQKLPEKNKDHNLAGNYEHHRECHISPDTLLIYKKENEYTPDS